MTSARLSCILDRAHHSTQYVACTSEQGRPGADLLISVHEVHDAIMVVVVMHILGCIHWQHQVVGPQPVTLCVSVTEDTSLKHLVITVPNTCSTQ